MTDCDKCGEHIIDCQCRQAKKKAIKEMQETVKRESTKLGNLGSISVDKKDLMDLIHWARRYCDGRYTAVASDFNIIYQRLEKKYPGFGYHDEPDDALSDNGENWPYASDGMNKKYMKKSDQY